MTKQNNRSSRDKRWLSMGYLPVPAAAAALQVSQARVYELAKAGELKSEKVGGAVYIQQESLQDYQREHTPAPGWIPFSEACASYGYSRTGMLYYVRVGKLQREVIGRKAYLYRPALEVLFGGGK